MFDLLDGLSGDRLTRPEYHEDVAKRRARADGHPSWKLERQQHFVEPYDESWQAFARGDWDEALRLIEADRDRLKEKMHDAVERGTVWYRVRVVEEPIAPYLQWELHALRLQAECDERIRVVGPEQIRGYEGEKPLPELVSPDAESVFRVIYDASGQADGAVRYTDPGVAVRCREFIRQLFDVGEEMIDFFDRRVARLAPPRVG